MSVMVEPEQDRLAEARRSTTCRVCFKPMAASESRWTVHCRGAEYQVCCPSCVQVFNRAPGQFVDVP